ncbi:MAG TPA: pyridoxal phosphate-dependent aminotransferase [Microthrixaceae bacterium]|nr:pyridoxal phosphate-dependent aminotransferase [Microthrixaceae bacterium]
MSAPTPPGRISRRVAGIAPSATLAVDAKAKAMKAAGDPVIGFGAGEPDFATPEPIVEAAIAACADPRNHRYTPAPGLPELRQAIATKTLRDSGVSVEPSQVVVTNGGKQAVYESILAVVDEGDEVLLPAPYWTTYPEPIRLAGGVPVVLPTTEATGFRVTVEALEAARTERTKALVFVSPSNPTGAVYPRAEIEAIGRWALEHGVIVITDEIYEHLVYGSAEFHSILAVVPELADQTIILNGVAKTYAMTGWRVGWLIGPSDVVSAVSNLQSHLCSNVANVAQMAALAAVSGDLSAVAMMRETFDRRRRVIHGMLNDIDGVTCPEPEGAFYAFPNLTGLLGRDLGGSSASSTLELADLVLERAKVAFVPGEAFDAPGYGRFSFALGDEDLVEGITRLQKLVAG